MKRPLGAAIGLGLALVSCGEFGSIEILVDNRTDRELIVSVEGGFSYEAPKGAIVGPRASGRAPHLILGQDQGFVGVFDLDCRAVAAFDLDPGDYRLVIEEGPRATIVPDTVPDDAPELTATTETCGVGPTPPQ